MTEQLLELREGEQEELIAWWLQMIQNPQSKFEAGGDHKWSAMDVANEIRSGSELGRSQLKALLIMRGDTRVKLE